MYVTHIICTKLILRTVSADCAYIIWEFLKPEEVTNILECHFCYILQQIIKFYLLIEWPFWYAFLDCATKFKDQ